MAKQWIVVSDAARARIFARNGADSGLTLLDTLTHSESQAHEGDLRTGGKGWMRGQVLSEAAVVQPDPGCRMPHV